MAIETTTPLRVLEKAPTGIEGFDQITMGGLPKGRPTVICGSAGCGKTLFALEFLIRGAVEFGEPGVFVAFEESAEDLEKNLASLGFNLPDLQKRGLIRIDHVKVDRAEIEESGEYDLEGLFIRLNYFVKQIGAKRVVLDTIETIFSGLSNETILRNELQRLFHWTKDQGLTTIITGERGEGQLTRQGLEEYVSDCVILLDHRVIEQISTRRLRIVKYRGSLHGTNEYPFLIDEEGFTVLPVTSLGLTHKVSSERISTGIAALDEMLGGEGVYKGSSVLLSGTSGTGKSTVASTFALAVCSRGEKCLYFTFEESEGQIVRNMRTIGLDLQTYIDQGLLVIKATRPMHYGLEVHLASMQREIGRLKPSAVIIDPVSNLEGVGTSASISAMLIRLVDFLKSRGTTGLFLSLTSGAGAAEATDVGMSSIMDTWLLLRDLETNGERNRGMYVLKARGTQHSNQIREFLITSNGIQLQEVFMGADGFMTGSARAAQEAKQRQTDALLAEERLRLKAHSEGRLRALEAQIVALQAEIEAEALEARAMTLEDESRIARNKFDLDKMAKSRRASTLMANTEKGV